MEGLCDDGFANGLLFPACSFSEVIYSRVGGTSAEAIPGALAGKRALAAQMPLQPGDHLRESRPKRQRVGRGRNGEACCHGSGGRGDYC